MSVRLPLSPISLHIGGTSCSAPPFTIVPCTVSEPEHPNIQLLKEFVSLQPCVVALDVQLARAHVQQRRVESRPDNVEATRHGSRLSVSRLLLALLPFRIIEQQALITRSQCRLALSPQLSSALSSVFSGVARTPATAAPLACRSSDCCRYPR